MSAWVIGLEPATPNASWLVPPQQQRLALAAAPFTTPAMVVVAGASYGRHSV